MEPLSLKEARLEWERGYWTRLLKVCDGRVRCVALIAHVRKSWVYVRLRASGIPYKVKRYGHRGQWGSL